MAEEFALRVLVSGIYAMQPDEAYLAASLRAITYSFVFFVFTTAFSVATLSYGVSRLQNRYVKTTIATLGFVALLVLPGLLASIFHDSIEPSAPQGISGVLFIHERLEPFFVILGGACVVFALSLWRSRSAGLGAT